MTMREYPIIFDAESVRAIIDGRKSQARQLVWHQSQLEFLGGDADDRNDPTLWGWPANGNGRDEYCTLARSQDHDHWSRCQYGEPGDRMWAREVVATSGPWNIPEACPLWYAADGGPMPSGYQIRSASFMPRWASRITLEITAVRIERLQAITHDDAIAEGSPYISGSHTDAGELPVEEYQRRWDATNARNGYPWTANPWVWVIEFRRVDQEARNA